MRNFTYSDFEKQSKKEEEILNLLGMQEGDNKKSLKKQSIDNVIAFSKSYKCHPSKSLGCIEYIAN